MAQTNLQAEVTNARYDHDDRLADHREASQKVVVYMHAAHLEPQITLGPAGLSLCASACEPTSLSAFQPARCWLGHAQPRDQRPNKWPSNGARSKPSITTSSSSINKEIQWSSCNRRKSAHNLAPLCLSGANNASSFQLYQAPVWPDLRRQLVNSPYPNLRPSSP